MVKIVIMPVGLLSANSYILYKEDGSQAAIIDPGGDGDTILKEVNARNLQIKYILLTHGHFDHIGALADIKKKTGAKVIIHREDASSLGDIFKNLSFSMAMESVQPEADILVEDGDIVSVHDMELEIIHTPGHSPGSISILYKDIIFTGDTLFQNSIGRTDLPGGKLNEILASIKDKILTLDDDVIVYPGHGPKTSILSEKLNNPFLRGLI